MFSAHTWHVAVRLVHVGAAAVVFGGLALVTLLLLQRRRADDATPLLGVVELFERVAWLALGVIVMTGVGNAGAIGRALPGPSSVWGGRFAVKLAAVLLLLLLSLVRSAAVTHAAARAPVALAAEAVNPLLRLYGLSVTLTGVILGLAVFLAHG
ncbi:MAG: hypothetical protein U0531_21025 [Dehalococcoidia bacterium]